MLTDMNHSARECSGSIITKSNFYLINNYLLKSQFPLNEGTNYFPVSADLSVDEESALCYVGGFMIWSLQKKIEKRKPKLLEEMIFALHSFLEDREQCDQSDTTDDSDNLDWVKVLDRGHCRMKFICLSMPISPYYSRSAWTPLLVYTGKNF